MARSAVVALNGLVPENLPVLSRPRDGAVIAGVCAGLARRMGVEPRVVRIIAVLTTIFLSGLGVALYIAGMLLTPRDGQSDSPLVHAIPALRRWPRGLLVGLVVLVGVAITWGSGAGAALVPAAVIGAVLWFGVFRPRHRQASASAEPTPFERAADAWHARLVDEKVAGFEGPASSAPSYQWQQPYTDPADRWVSDDDPGLPAVRPRRRSWRLWGLAIALSGVGTGAVAVLHVVWGLPATPLAYLAAVLAALGLTAIVGAWRGRPPLLVPAILAVAAATAFHLAPAPTAVGDYNRAFSDESQLPATIEVPLGDVNLDLRDLHLTSDRTLTVRAAAGDVTLDLPTQARSSVSWQLGAGEAKGSAGALGRLGAKSFLSQPASTSGPTLTIHVEDALGDLVVNP